MIQMIKKNVLLREADKARFKEMVIDDAKFRKWCKLWRGSLVIHVLGKHVGFRILEAKLQTNSIS